MSAPKLDHAKAKEYARLIDVNPNHPVSNLAACYLDSVPKEKYGELLRLAKEVASTAGEDDSLWIEMRVLRAYIEKEEGHG